MRDATGQLPNAFHFLRLTELGFALPQGLLGLFPFHGVPNSAHEKIAVQPPFDQIVLGAPADRLIGHPFVIKPREHDDGHVRR